MEELFKITNLNSYYVKSRSIEDIFTKKAKKRLVKILDNVSFSIYSGEILGLVGESGCGKTTLAKCILQLIENVEGEILFGDQNILKSSKKEIHDLRKYIQMIFQNPYSSLNHNMKTFDIISEAVKIKKNSSAHSVRDIVYGLCEKVNFPLEKLKQYPFQLSGGERRRVGLARILAVNPIFIAADEPLAALDSSIKSQIINLLIDLKNQYNITYLIISHDMGFVKYISQRVAVMYLGKIVEIGRTKNFRAKRCLHPYTLELLESSDFLSTTGIERKPSYSYQGVEITVPDLSEISSGCKFKHRCVLYNDLNQPEICREQDPSLINLNIKYYEEHYIACHFWERSQK